MEVRFWAATDVGKTRDHNEDNFLVDKKLNLFVVADGMGGHAAGEVASSVAVREVRRLYAERRELIEAYEDEESSGGVKAILRLIEEAIQGACARIYELAQEDEERRGMGTTCSVLLIAGKRGFIGHVGDSRIYMTRDGEVHQLTEDHSLANELIKRGRLKPGEAFDSPYKNAVTRAVGVYQTVAVDTFEFDIVPGDTFLLCSDGLHCYLTDELMVDYMSDPAIKKIPERFINWANDSGGKDNITAIVVRALEGSGESPEQGSEVRVKIETLRGVSLFKYLTYKELVKVVNITTTRQFPKGFQIFAENTSGETLFIVLEGGIKLTVKGQELAVLNPGTHFGEMALVDKAPRSATATTTTDTRLLAIERSHFYELMRQDPTMSVKLMWSFMQVLNARLRIANRDLQTARQELLAAKRGETLLEMPPAVSFDGAMAMTETQELTPGFLFDEANAKNKEAPVPSNMPAFSVDLDTRPGSANPTPASPSTLALL